jgi:hypothetical protein
MALPMFDVLTLRENEDFARTYSFVDSSNVAVSWTGKTASMMVRADVGDSTPALAISSGAGITLGAGGTIVLNISDAQIAAMLAGTLGLRRRGVFNLITTDAGGVRQTWLEGIVEIRRSPTR